MSAAAAEPHTGTGVDAIAAVKALLGETLRVTLTDGRVFEGVFSCLDKGFNVVLNEASEVSLTGARKQFNARAGGVIIVPGARIAKCETHAQPLL